MKLKHHKKGVVGPRFSSAIGSLFDDYFRRYRAVMDPYYLPPALEVVYLRGAESMSATPDLDNILRTVVDIFQQKVMIDVRDGIASYPFPLTSEIIRVPGWEQTGMSGITSIGLVPGAPFHISYSAEIDELVEKWGESS